MKKAFTMIELIFVIVIIGILAAVAIPRLAATRDDARASKSIYNLRTCLVDITSVYTAMQQEDNTSASCESVAQDACFTLSGIQTTSPDGNITFTHSSLTDSWCTEAQRLAADQNLSTSAGQVHSFGGSKIVR